MEIKRIITGALDENCYVLIKNNTAIIVDPGDDYLNIKEAIGDNKILGVLITHSHFDHIGALRNFLTKRSIKIFSRLFFISILSPPGKSVLPIDSLKIKSPTNIQLSSLK